MVSLRNRPIPFTSLAFPTASLLKTLLLRASTAQDFTAQDFIARDFIVQDLIVRDFIVQDLIVRDFIVQDLIVQDFIASDFIYQNFISQNLGASLNLAATKKKELAKTLKRDQSSANAASKKRPDDFRKRTHELHH